MSLSCQRPLYFSFHKRQRGCLAGISGKVRAGNLISHMIVLGSCASFCGLLYTQARLYFLLFPARAWEKQPNRSLSPYRRRHCYPLKNTVLGPSLPLPLRTWSRLYLSPAQGGTRPLLTFLGGAADCFPFSCKVVEAK
jgi:hypothetical protein